MFFLEFFLAYWFLNLTIPNGVRLCKMKMYLRIMMALFGVLILLGGIGAVKGVQIGEMIAQSESFVPPPQTVTVATATLNSWEKTLSAVGSLDAVQGMLIAAELAGKVDQLSFQSGAWVKAGELILQQDISEERAALRAADSRARLALKNLQRSRTLKNEDVITESVLDDRVADHEQAVDLQLPDVIRDPRDVAIPGHEPAGAQFRAAPRDPAVNGASIFGCISNGYHFG